MSTLFETLASPPDTAPAPAKRAPRAKRQRDTDLDDILDDPKSIELMKADVLKIKGTMERHSAWSELAFQAAQRARTGESIQVKRQGLQVLLMMASVKSEIQRTTVNFQQP